MRLLGRRRPRKYGQEYVHSSIGPLYPYGRPFPPSHRIVFRFHKITKAHKIVHTVMCVQYRKSIDQIASLEARHDGQTGPIVLSKANLLLNSDSLRVCIRVGYSTYSRSLVPINIPADVRAGTTICNKYFFGAAYRTNQTRSSLSNLLSFS